MSGLVISREIQCAGSRRQERACKRQVAANGSSSHSADATARG